MPAIMQSPIRFTLRSKAFIPSGIKLSLYPIILFKINRLDYLVSPTLYLYITINLTVYILSANNFASIILSSIEQ